MVFEDLRQSGDEVEEAGGPGEEAAGEFDLVAELGGGGGGEGMGRGCVGQEREEGGEEEEGSW